MRRGALVAVCLCLVLVAGGCSRAREVVAGNDPTPAATGTPRATSLATPSPSPQPSPTIEDLTLKGKKKKGRKDKGGVAAAPMGPPGSQKPPPKLEPQGDGGARYARLSASVTEPQPDGEKEGDPPDYAEARAVDIKGRGDTFRVTITFFDDVPQRMPTDQTYMVIGLGMSGRSSDDSDYGFGARASREGWLAYAGTRGSASQFPGTFFVRGNRIEMNIPWRAVGGPRPFQWYASSSWFEYSGGTTSYLFDPIPNGRAKYPN